MSNEGIFELKKMENRAAICKKVLEGTATKEELFQFKEFRYMQCCRNDIFDMNNIDYIYKNSEISELLDVRDTIIRLIEEYKKKENEMDILSPTSMIQLYQDYQDALEFLIRKKYGYMRFEN